MGDVSSLAVVALTFGGKEISTKAFAEVNGKVAETAFTLAVDVEMAIYTIPFLIFLPAFGLEVSKEVHTLLLLVEKVKFLVEQLLEATATDSLRLFHHGGVELSFAGICRMPVEIYSQTLTAAEPVGVRISDWGIEVEVERYAVARYFLFTKENFSAGIHCILKELKV